MFKFNKKHAQDADMSILDELIAKCEDSMVSPFKKKSAVAIEVKPDDHDEEQAESPDEEKSEGLSDEDLQEMLEMLKGKKSRE